MKTDPASFSVIAIRCPFHPATPSFHSPADTDDAKNNASSAVANTVKTVSTPRTRPRLARLASLAGVFIGVAGIAFVVRTIVNSWNDVTDAYAQLNATGLALSLVLGLSAMTWIGVLWIRMLSPTDSAQPDTRLALSWYFVGQLGKYVPGAIWPIVGRAELATRAGIPRGHAYGATARSMLTTYLGATVAVAIGSVLSWTDPFVGLIAAAALTTLWWVAAHDAVRTRLVAAMSRVVATPPTLPEASHLAVTAARHVPAWILMSLSTSVVASAFQVDIGLVHMLYVTSLSWLIGFVVIGVPGGLGVREAVFISMLGPTVGDGAAASIAIASRMVFIAVDGVGAIVSTLLARGRTATSAKS